MEKIEEVALYDGSKTKIKYSYQENSSVRKLVIFVNGSGQNTYDNKRKNPNGGFFNYHDYFRNEFLSRNVAYCSYNARGVDLGDDEPLYASIDWEEYKKYKPNNSVMDIEAIIRHLTSKLQFRDTKVFLLGWSEGTIIAPLVALRKNVRVDGLLLAGYCNENLKDTLIWQLSGNSSYINMKKHFDKNNKGYIAKEDFESADVRIRKAFFGDFTFDYFDRNSDGQIDVSDFALLQKPFLDELFDAISRNDDDWMKNNYLPPLKLTSGWFGEHFSLEPTKNILPELDLPIYIFHGTDDANCPVKYAYDIKDEFQRIGKNNLNVSIFDNHDHDLNFTEWLLKDKIPEGIKRIFDTVDEL